MGSLDLSHADLQALLVRASDLAAAHWEGLDDRPVSPRTNGDDTEAQFRRPWAEDGAGFGVLEDFKSIAERSRSGNARFFGYVFGSGEPVGAVGELLAAALNQNCTSWRSAPAAVTIERTVVDWLASAIGCHSFAGSLCGGGSTANLMGLAMAREAKSPANLDGCRGGILYASDQVHMSIPKAVALLGLGVRNLRRIPTGSDHRMDVDALRRTVEADRASGLTPIAVVATAGTVALGAVDPIKNITTVCRDFGLWLHVDGAFGALAAMARPDLFEGLSSADSISLDAHKWLYQSMECGCLLYADRTRAHAAFSYADSYVATFSQDPVEGFAYFEESIELSRRFRALKLWLSLQYHGKAAYRSAIEADLQHARTLARLVDACSDLVLAGPVALSAVCFRHAKADNAALLRRVNDRGRVYLSNAMIDGQFCLRACFVNHRTSETDVAEIIAEVLAAAETLDGRR